jgi:hypothetical protein
MDFYSLGFPSLVHEHLACHRLADEHVLVLRMPLYQAPANWSKIYITSVSPLLRRSGRAVYLYSTAHKTQLTIIQLEDFLHASLFPDLLPQPIGGFINNIFRELNATT